MPKINMQVSNTCTCTYVNADDIDCPAENCFGDCWDDQLDWLNETILKPWIERNGWDWDTDITIMGSNMSWLGVSGYCDTTPSEVVRSLSINGDFTLRFSLVGSDLTCLRSSHDEYSAKFEFVLTKNEQEH
jgi:hypothetical protein